MGNNRRRGKRIDDDGRPGSWVAYGRLLKFFRTKAGLTQEELADRMGYSLDHCASVEQGRRPAKAEFTERAEEVVEAGGVLAELQDEVDFAQLPTFFRDLATLEKDAVVRLSYDPLTIPGLLQTEEYARCMLNGTYPPVDEETVDNWLTARLARQALLTRKNPLVTFAFIIEEATLHRIVGGRDVMRAQLRRLLESAELRNVEIQIMPSARAVHSGLSGHMVLLETAEGKQFVYAEAQGCVMSRAGREQTGHFWLRYGSLRALALSTEESVRLIEEVAGEL
ncbi:helix-turn-helix transcriptional regulator [Streptomyces sp. NBC_01808]|uniref:helix-turn-helix domain-containing protein n=1 Tax=Streptomyces sp. NBC_01808 TaxID=2975947 RepID=UPI002DDA5668|nr:helix-turn-helix transcriptional regulator [Streptomyces sp. NBC_01808]WSA38051.1 helix-turn-helix transcriptional regulator [Streptomyces sp. NBC_01808]